MLYLGRLLPGRLDRIVNDNFDLLLMLGIGRVRIYQYIKYRYIKVEGNKLFLGVIAKPRLISNGVLHILTPLEFT